VPLLAPCFLARTRPPAIHAAQHERAGRARIASWLLIDAGCTRPTLPPALRGWKTSGYGHLTRSRPQDSPPIAAAPQWEPRKPLAGIHAAMRADEMLERVMWRAMRSGGGW
jgi:hypothetical protein